MAILKGIKDRFHKFTHRHPNIWRGIRFIGIPLLLVTPILFSGWYSNIPLVGSFLENLNFIFALIISTITASLIGNLLFYALGYILAEPKNSYAIRQDFTSSPLLAEIELKLQRIEDYDISRFGLKLKNIATALAAKKLKRQKKQGNLNAYVVDHLNFDVFLDQIKSHKNKLIGNKKLNFQFVLRARGSDDTGRHFVFGEVLATKNQLDFLIVDPEGTTFPELLGEGYQYKYWQTNTTNFIKKINNKFSDVENFNLITSLETLQTSQYGCGYLSIFGCFDLSSLKPEYMSLSENNSSDTSMFSSYASIFEYMKNHEVPEVSSELKAINTERGWRKMINDIRSTVIPDTKGKTAEDHYRALKKSGARVCTLPDHLVRNQQILGGPDDIKSFPKPSENFSDPSIRHFKGLYARAVYHEPRALNKKGQTLQDLLFAHTVQGKNNRLSYKIESLKATIDSFYADRSMSDREKEQLIQDCIWKPSMVMQ